MSEKLSPEDQKWLDKHESELTPELEPTSPWSVEQYTDGTVTWADDGWKEDPESAVENYRQEIRELERLLDDDGDKVTPEKRKEWEDKLESLKGLEYIYLPEKLTKKQAAQREAELEAYWKEQNALWQEFYDEKWCVMKLAPTERRLCELMTKYPNWIQAKYAKKLGITQSQVSRVLERIKKKQQLAAREIGGGHTNPDFQFRHWLKNRNNK